MSTPTSRHSKEQKNLAAVAKKKQRMALVCTTSIIPIFNA